MRYQLVLNKWTISKIFSLTVAASCLVNRYATYPTSSLQTGKDAFTFILNTTRYSFRLIFPNLDDLMYKIFNRIIFQLRKKSKLVVVSELIKYGAKILCRILRKIQESMLIIKDWLWRTFPHTKKYRRYWGIFVNNKMTAH